MIKRRYTPFAFCCLLVGALIAASGCSLMVNPLTRLWFFTYGTGAPEGKDTMLSPASFLELRPDGSYTRDFGRFEFGTWLKKNGQVLLTSHDRHLTALTFSLPGPGEMQLTMTGGYVAEFDSRTIPAQKGRLDPFSLENNRWRVPPNHKESDAGIRDRLRNHCEFWAAYFRWALDKDLSSVDVRSTPTPIKIFGNGFTLKPAADLPAAWVACFYDSADCLKANDMIKEVFEHRTIAWAHTDSKYKMFLSAFQQMANYFH